MYFAIIAISWLFKLTAIVVLLGYEPFSGNMLLVLVLFAVASSYSLVFVLFAISWIHIHFLYFCHPLVIFTCYMCPLPFLGHIHFVWCSLPVPGYIHLRETLSHFLPFPGYFTLFNAPKPFLGHTYLVIVAISLPYSFIAHSWSYTCIYVSIDIQALKYQNHVCWSN